jgi:hypothetical protein
MMHTGRPDGRPFAVEHILAELAWPRCRNGHVHKTGSGGHMVAQGTASYYLPCLMWHHFPAGEQRES